MEQMKLMNSTDLWLWISVKNTIEQIICWTYKQLLKMPSKDSWNYAINEEVRGKWCKKLKQKILENVRSRLLPKKYVAR